MSVKASGRIAFSKVPSVESETRYFLLTESSSIVPSKPTTVPPTGGWTQTEPTYSDNSATSTLYTCVLTQFTNDTFAYSEVSISSAYEAAKEAYNKAQQVADTVDGLTLIQDGKVVIDGGKVYANDAFIQSIFAQDITATGRIKSSNYNGTASNPLSNTAGSILKLDTGAFNFGGGALLYDGSDLTVKGKMRGNAIDIQAVIDATSIGLKTELVDNSYCLVLSAAGGTTKGEITLSRGVLKLFGQSLLELATDELYINADTITDANYSEVSYTSFSGSVVSDGTLTVTKKLGMCFLNGGITLTAAASGWVTLLDSSAVPAPQSGEAIIMTLPSWKAPTTNPARLRIPAGGGLQITRGSANAFWINLAYPIE